MPSIQSIELAVSGRRRRASLRVTGSVAFDGTGDAALNGAYLRVRLHAVDSPIRDVDDAGRLLAICDTWFNLGHMERYEPAIRWSGRHSGSENWQGGQINATRDERARFRFLWDNRRTEDDFVLERAFNEDRPGQDEVVAVALCLPSLADGTPEPRGASRRKARPHR